MPLAYIVPETNRIEQVEIVNAIDDFVIIKGSNINPNCSDTNNRKVLLIHLYKLEKLCNE